MMAPTPRELAQWMYKKMQSNKKEEKCITPWLLFSVITKMKIRKSVGADPYDGPNLDGPYYGLGVRCTPKAQV